MAPEGQDRIPAGYVRRAHGIHGDVVVRGMLQDAADRFVPGAVLLTNEDTPRNFEIVGVRSHQGDYIVTFNEIGDRTTADALRGIQFVIDRADRRDLEPGEWWPEDIEGCDVYSKDGDVVGVIASVITGAAQDRIVVETPEGAKAEVPFVSELVPQVDVEHRRIVVELPEGIFE
jgi:16S rRNA processing protein RimM